MSLGRVPQTSRLGMNFRVRRWACWLPRARCGARAHSTAERLLPLSCLAFRFVCCSRLHHPYLLASTRRYRLFLAGRGGLSSFDPWPHGWWRRSVTRPHLPHCCRQVRASAPSDTSPHPVCILVLLLHSCVSHTSHEFRARSPAFKWSDLRPHGRQVSQPPSHSSC